MHAPPPPGGSSNGDNDELDASEGDESFIQFHPRGAVMQNGSEMPDGSAFIAHPGEPGLCMKSLADVLPGDGKASVDLDSSDDDN